MRHRRPDDKCSETSGCVRAAWTKLHGAFVGVTANRSRRLDLAKDAGTEIRGAFGRTVDSTVSPWRSRRRRSVLRHIGRHVADVTRETSEISTYSMRSSSSSLFNVHEFISEISPCLHPAAFIPPPSSLILLNSAFATASSVSFIRRFNSILSSSTDLRDGFVRGGSGRNIQLFNHGLRQGRRVAPAKPVPANATGIHAKPRRSGEIVRREIPREGGLSRRADSREQANIGGHLAATRS